MDGGLFSKAKTGATDTQLKADKETLTAAVVGCYNGTTGEIEGENLEGALDGWKVVEGNDNWTCTSVKGNIFTVTKSGKITEGEENTRSNTYEGKYYGGSDRALKFVDTNYLITYLREGSVWYYESSLITDFFENVQIIDKTDSDFINYCNKWSIDINNVSNYIIKRKSNEYTSFSYFNLDYTVFYDDGYDFEEPIVRNLITDSEFITLLENATIAPEK